MFVVQEGTLEQEGFNTHKPVPANIQRGVHDDPLDNLVTVGIGQAPLICEKPREVATVK